MFLCLIAYLALVLIRPQDYPALVDAIGAPLQQIALLLAAGLWLFSGRKSFDAPQYLVLVAFLLVLMLSQIANGWSGGAIVQLTKFGPTLLAFVLLANAANTRARTTTTMAVFALGAAVLAWHGIDQVKTGIGWTGVELSQGTRIQYVGIFNDPNDLGLLFVMCLPMAFFLSSRGGFMGLRKLFWYAVAAALVYGIYLTDSRGSLLALVVLLGVYVWKTRGAFSAAVLGVGALSGMMLLPSRMQELDVSEASAMGRVDSWYEGLQMFLAHPLLGVGPDQYSDHHFLTAHNSFVLVLAETGIIGFTVWLAFIGYCFRMMLTVLHHVPVEVPSPAAGTDGETSAAAAWKEDRALALTLFLSLCGFFASAFFLSRSYVVILYLLAAIVVGYYVEVRERHPTLPAFSIGEDLLRWPLWSVLGVTGMYVAVKVLLATA